MAYIITIANEKGGVSKTTSTISLGAALVESGSKVLLVDLDSQANLTLALGTEPEKVQRSVVNVLMESTPMSSIIQETGIPNLFIAPSNHEMGVAERFLPTRSGYEQLLRKALYSLPESFDFIIIDCPPFMGAVTINALTAADLLVIPTQAEYFSIYAIRNMMGLIRRVRSQSNPTLTYSILLTMFDRRNRIHRTLAEQLHSTFANGLLTSRVEIDTKLRESSITGLPIIYQFPKSRAAIQYRALAQEIMEYAKEEIPQPA